MSVTSKNRGISGTGYLSDDNRTEEGLLIVHGVALGNNDVTLGAKSKERKLWRPEVLEESAHLLEDKDIVVNHENQDAYEKVGEVTDARYDPDKGVIYQGVVKDDELEEKIELGWLDVSPKLLHSSEYDEFEGVKAPEAIHDFPNLSIVRKGASPSNELQAGQHPELSVEELQASFEEEEGVQEYHYRSEDEELQTPPEDVDYAQWMYKTAEAAQGAVESFPCDGIHEHTVQGEKWFMPCSSHDDFLKSLEEMNEEEMQLSEPRTPDYSGTETSSWGDVSKTLDNFLSGVSGDVSDVESVDDLTQEQRNDLASHSLLGDPEGESFDEILFFPVVNPDTNNLNRGALEAVRSGRGQSADISDSAMESAYRVAGELLNEEFDADVEEEMSMHGDAEMSFSSEEKQMASQLSSHTEMTKDESLRFLSTIKNSPFVDIHAVSKAIGRGMDIDEQRLQKVLSEMSGHMEKEQLQEADEDLRSAVSVIADRWEVSTGEALQVIDALRPRQGGDLRILAGLLSARSDIDMDAADIMDVFDDLRGTDDSEEENSLLSDIIG